MKKRSLFRFILMTLVLSLTVSMLGSCLYLLDLVDDFENETELELVDEAKMTYVFNDETGYYDVSIRGILKNPKNTDVTGGYVTFIVYDSEGNTICSAEDYISKIEAGGTWRFCAVGSSRYSPASFEIDEHYSW
jgi:hypothetical protein